MASNPDMYIGSAGNLVAAALQTAGFYLQGDILVTFKDLFQSLAMLFWIASAVGALYAIAIGGSYKQGLLLLLGPALFWIATSTTVATATSNVQTGSRIDHTDIEAHLEFLKLTTDDARYSKPARVSWFFAQYDKLVTSTVQNLVNFLTDVNNKRDIVATVREQVYLQILAPSGQHAHYGQLVSLILVGECAKLTQRSADESNIQNDIATLQKNPSENRGAERLAQLQAKLAQTTKEIGELKKTRITLPNDLQAYVATFVSALEGQSSITCSEIWDGIREASLHEANIRINEETTSSNTLIPWAKVKQEVEAAITKGKPQTAAEIVAPHLLRNTIAAAPHQSIVTNVYDRSPVGASFQDFLFGDWNFAFGEGYLLSLQYFSGIVPYVQGLLLFLLGGLMPFFALLFLIPSRMNGVLVWFGLWAWVKSWDIGFAMINFVRDALWTHFFSRVPLSMPTTPPDWANPATIFQYANSYDPSANMTTYLVLINTLCFAVPIVSAQMFAGASTLANNLGSALDVAARRFQNQGVSGARRGIAHRLEQGVHQSNLNAQSSAVQAALKADPSGGKITNSAGTFSRRETGDGAYSRHVAGIGMQAEVRNAYTDEQGERQAQLAMLNNRPIQQGGGFGTYSNSLLAVMMNTKNEQLEARPWTQGSKDMTQSGIRGPGANSPLASNNATRPRATKGGGPNEATKQAGDAAGGGDR